MRVKIRNIFREKPEDTHDKTVNIHRLVRPNEIDAKIGSYNYAWLMPKEAFEPHFHDDCIEYFLILEGSGILISSNKNKKNIQKKSIKIGDLITVKPATLHSIKNTSDTKMIFISLRCILKK